MDYWVKFIIFAFKFNLPIMIVKYEKQKLNRIKIVLAETEKTGKWLAEQLGRDPVTVSKWCTNSAQPDLPGAELGEEVELLWQVGQGGAAQREPVVDGESGDVLAVETDMAGVVAPRTVYICT